MNQYDFPLGVRLFNSVCEGITKQPVDADQLMEKAQRKSGLTDYGDRFFEEPLRRFIDDGNKSTRFHALGAHLFRKKILINLVNRLWAQYWLKKDPSINTELPPIVLITGLQRTGTTFLQRLLGHLPEFRGVLSWEVVNPVPVSKKKNYHGIHQAKMAHFALNYINPEFKSIHSVRHDSLEEEVVMMDHSFVSTASQAALHVPHFAKWVEQQDQTKYYEDLKMWLQFLIWRKPAQKFLLLKSPHHMEYMETFLKVFPNTRVIQTHREPARSLASYCSMVYSSKKLFMPAADPHEVGKYWLYKNGRLVDNCLDFRKKHDDLVYDIAYHDLVADPITVAQKLFQHVGIEWTDKHTEMATEYCREHKKNKFGKHQYQLSDYGLSNDLVNDRFSNYMEKFATELSATTKFQSDFVQ